MVGRAKVLWVTLAAISVMAMAGVGFASFIASGSGAVTGNAGTTSFSFSDITVVGSGSSAGSVMTGCTAPTPSATSSGGATLTVTLHNMAPGDGCAVGFEITNTGSLPGTWTVTPGSPPSSSCWEWLPASSSTGTLNAGSTTADQTVLGLELQDDLATGDGFAPNSCEGTSATVSATITLEASDIGEGWETGIAGPL
jgi:hypothetical protein